MDSDVLFFVLLIGLAVLSALGSLAWWVFVVWAGYKTASLANSSIEAQIAATLRAMEAFSKLPANQRSTRSGEMAAMLSRMDTHMRDMDRLTRDRYDVQIGELSSMAASAGFNWTPPS